MTARVDSFEIDAASGVVRITAEGPAGQVQVIAQSAPPGSDATLLAAAKARAAAGPPGLYAWTGSDVVAMPQRPSSGHEWSWVSMAWSISLRDAQEAKLQDISSWRDAKEFAPFTWQGLVFDATPDSLRRLTVAAAGAREAVANERERTVMWTLADNTAVELSADDILAVMLSYGDALDAAHAAARELKAAVRAATTVEQVMAIQLPQ